MMATLRNKGQLAVFSTEAQEELPGKGWSRNTFVPRINEDHITQVLEKIEGRVSIELSQEFSRTESSILNALSKLDEFFLNAQVRTQSGTVRGTSRNTDVENQEPIEDRSQNYPCPRVGSSVYRYHPSVDSDPGETPHTSNSTN